MDMRKKTTYTIIGYFHTTSGVEQPCEVKDVKGILAARNITTLWMETGRFSKVTYAPKH